MIEQTIIIVLTVSIVFLIGMVFGQHTVWESLRENRHVIINDWYYTAVKSKEGQYKRWE